MRYILHGKIWDICYTPIEQGRLEANPITNMRLHKILYYMQGFYLADNGRPLFREKMYAWQYGPVVYQVYKEFKEFGSKPLNTNRIRYANALSDSEKIYINQIWDSTKKYSVNQLVNLTHRAGGPWSKVYDPNNHNNVIEQHLIADYFKGLIPSADWSKFIRSGSRTERSTNI